jgi:hypothetical protein
MVNNKFQILSLFVILLLAACWHPPGSTEVSSPPPTSSPPVAARSPKAVSSSISDVELRALLDEFKDPDTYVRQEAARVLGEAGDPRAQVLLTHAESPGGTHPSLAP